MGADSKDNKGERNTKQNGTKKSRPVLGGLGGQTFRQTDRQRRGAGNPTQTWIQGCLGDRPRDRGWGWGEESRLPAGTAERDRQGQQRQTDRASVKAQGRPEARQEGRTGPAPCGNSLSSQRSKSKPCGEPGLARAAPPPELPLPVPGFLGATGRDLSLGRWGGG